MRLPVLLRFAVVLAALAALGGVASVACLPDLDVSAAEDAGGPPSLCGDGIIEPDAGEQCDPGSGEGGTTTACRECRVACVVGSESTTIDPTTNHCYFEPGNTVQETDAVSQCEVAGGHVVRFVSENELAFVTNWAATRPFWVGIVSQTGGGWFPNENTPEPGFIANCPGCFAGGPDGGDIVKGTAAADTGRCVSAGQGTWTESICSQTVKSFSLWTVCEREPVGVRATPCGSNTCLTVTATLGAKSYVIVPTPLEANDAALACATVGGRLAVFGSAEEREQVAHEIDAQRALPQTGLWIGLSTGALGTWAWDADGGMSPIPWGFEQPGGDAGVGRAYILVAQGQSAPDSELARAGNATDAGGEMHLPLCEVP